MSKGTQYSDEFKQEAVNQVVVHSCSMTYVSQRLGISNKSLCDWIKVFSKPKKQRDEDAVRTEVTRLI